MGGIQMIAAMSEDSNRPKHTVDSVSLRLPDPWRAP